MEHWDTMPQSAEVIMLRKALVQRTRDLNDCLSAVHTRFHRCKCGRLAEQGIICPTVQEGGDCEAGR